MIGVDMCFRSFMLIVVGFVLLDTSAVCLCSSATFFLPRLIMRKTVQASSSTTMASTPVIRPMYACVLLVGLVAGVTSFLACVVSPRIPPPGGDVEAEASGWR